MATAWPWRHAVSTGLPWSGSLADGTQLPLDGPDWVTWNPVTDSSPNAPKRLYGTERTIRTIVSVAAAFRTAHPDAPRLVIGDISREDGGPMNEHVSHQNGLDVDIRLVRSDGVEGPADPSTYDPGLTQELLDRLIAMGAQYVFVGPSLDLHGPPGIVVNWPNHDDHLHWRIPDPDGLSN